MTTPKNTFETTFAALQKLNHEATAAKYWKTLMIPDCGSFKKTSLQELIYEATKSRNLKALLIRNCSSFKKSMDMLSNEVFCEFFRLMPDLFFVVIEVQKSLEKRMNQLFDHEKLKFNSDARPWIVQITSTTTKNSIILFKDEGVSHVYIENYIITNRGQLFDKNHFEKFIGRILQNILRCSNMCLLDLNLNLDQLNSLKDKGDLSQKFLEFMDDSEIGISRDDQKEYRNQMQKNKNRSEIVDSKNYNKLMVAIEQKDEALIDTLMESYFDFAKCGNDGKRAVDLAIDHEMFDVFVKLIEADSPFPAESQISKMPAQSEAFKKFCNVNSDRNDFHGLVMAGDMESLKSHLSKNFLNFAYNRHNKSALTCAIEQKQFKVFAFLQSVSFSKGIDPFYDEAFAALTDDEKNQIASYNLEFFSKFSSEHVFKLIRKTKIASSLPDRSKSYEEIWKFYNDLDAIREVSVVLQILAHIDNLTISFDFESSDVQKMHPSQSQNTGGVYFEGGFIYIGAGQWESDRDEVLSVVAHEFTHCAIKEVYKNKCKPYKAIDIEREKEFENIVETIRTVVANDDSPEKIVSSVYHSYTKSSWITELIVRVPHLLAKYKGDSRKIKELRQNFVDLFTFFEEKTLPDLLGHLKSVEYAEEVNILNNNSGLVKLIDNEEIEFKTSKAAECFVTNDECKINVVVSNSPIHSMAALIKHLDKHDNLHMTMDLKFLVKQFSSIQKLLRSNQKLFLIINSADQLDECMQKFLKIIQELEKRKILLIVEENSEKQKSLTMFDESNSNVFHLNHEWNDLTVSYQTKIMQASIKFQGNSFPLKDLLGNDSCQAFDFLPLNKFVGGRQFALKEAAIKSSKFYFPRRFFIELEEGKGSDTIFSCDDVLAQVERQNFAIISGITGSGKSIALKGIAKVLNQKFPDRWVSFVDLKKHTNVFKSDLSTLTFEEFAFKLTTSQSEDINFKREMFKHFYANGKVLLLLDSFDDIAPHYKEIISAFLLKYLPKKGNQVWVTTRSHLQKDLEKTFGVSSFQLLDFDEDEQIDFLLKYWQEKPEISVADPALYAHAQSIVKKFNELLSGYSIGIPLLMEVLASSYKEKLSETFNLYSLFEEYFERTIEIWRNQRGQLPADDQIQIEKSGDAVMNVHQSLALKLLFEPEEIDEFDINVKYDADVWTEAAMVRVGLILCSNDHNDKPQFVHRTFAEFLVARFVVQNLRTEVSTKALKVFFKILSNDKTVVCQFLHYGLVDDHFKNFKNAELSNEVKKYFKRKIDERVNLTQVILAKNQEQIFRLFVEIARKILTENEIKSMLKNKTIYNVNDNIVLLLSQHGNKELVDKFTSFVKECLSPKEYKDLMFELVHIDGHCLQPAFYDRSSLKLICKGVTSCFQNEKGSKIRERKYRSLFLHVAKKRKLEFFQNFIEIMKEILNESKIKTMLKAKDVEGRNIFSLRFGFSESLKQVLEILKEILSKEEIIEMIFSVDNNGNCLLKYAFDTEKNSSHIINTLFSDLKGLLSEEQQKRFINIRNEENQNLFALASCADHDERGKTCLEVLVYNAKEIIEESKIRTMLIEANLEEISF